MCGYCHANRKTPNVKTRAILCIMLKALKSKKKGGDYMYISIDTPGFFDMADFDGEYWKNLYGFEDNYEISNYGRIKRKHRVWHSSRNGS